MWESGFGEVWDVRVLGFVVGSVGLLCFQVPDLGCC